MDMKLYQEDKELVEALYMEKSKAQCLQFHNKNKMKLRLLPKVSVQNKQRDVKGFWLAIKIYI